MPAQKKAVFYLACQLLIASTSAQGFDAVEVSAGKANHGIDVLRLALHQSWSRHWWVSSHGELSGFHAVSVNRWADEGQAINVLAYSPVFVYQFRDAPLSYVKFGVGAAYISDTQLKGRIFSTHFQFEDQLGVGWQWDDHDVSLVYMHYSNAGIEKPNQGIDMLLLSYAWRLD